MKVIMILAVLLLTCCGCARNYEESRKEDFTCNGRPDVARLVHTFGFRCMVERK
jgi:hypothetical protein